MSDLKVYAEDLAVDDFIDLGEIVLSEEEIITFARQWDPQSFHTNDSGSSEHYFGGLVASGAHTLAAFQRLAVLGAHHSWAVMAGKALRDVLFLHPVRPGDRLHGGMRITSIHMTDGSRALVSQFGRLTVRGKPVFEMTIEAYVYRRPGSTPHL